MDAFDIESILAKNPQIDRNELSRFLKEKKIEHETEKTRGSISPYDGRRMIVDERSQEEGLRASRRTTGKYAKA